MKLSKAQVELLEAMKNGAKCIHVRYSHGMSSYYFRTDTMKRCTRTARSLLNKGLVEVIRSDWRGHELAFKKQESTK